MAIVKMSKFNLLIFGEDRERLLKELQTFKYVHFQNLHEDEELVELGLEKITVPESIAAINEEINQVKYSIELLSRYYEKKSVITTYREGLETLEFSELEKRAAMIDHHEIYAEIRKLDSKKEQINQEISSLQEKIAELLPWRNLNIPFENLATFTQCKVFLGSIPKKRSERFYEDFEETTLSHYEVIDTDQENVYVLILGHRSYTEEISKLLYKHGFASVHFSYRQKPAEVIASLNNRIKDLQKEFQSIEADFRNLATHLPDLQIMYEYLMNKKIRVAAQENFLKTEHIDVLKGYIPTDLEDDFTEIIKKTLNNVYYLVLEEAEKEDPEVPILLRNSKFSNSFESITSMYALPKYNEIDPTPLFSLIYCLFFGMMVADFGYGLVMWLGTFLILKLFNLPAGQKQFIRFFYYLSYGTMFWGLIYGSFFGGVIELPSLIDPMNNYSLVLILAIAIGIIHIFYALGIKGYMAIRDGRPLEAVYDVLFWYFVLGGSIVYLVSMYVPALVPYQTIATYAMIIGAIGIILTGGRDAKTIGGKLASGLYSLYGITGYVGDFVSYSRLMALGLSGGFIASAVNMMVGMLFDTGFVGWIFGILVFIIGQGFNIFLSCLSGYVHTLRLTYVEFFDKFYEGGGKAFRLFRSQPKYINIKE